MKIGLILIFLTSLATAQVTVTGPLTITNSPSDTHQSGIVFSDRGYQPDAPAAGKYSLFIVNGMLQESDNGGPYHSLVGPAGKDGVDGSIGPQGPPGVITGNTVTASGSMTCAPAKGFSVPSGFTCTFTNMTFKINSIH